MFGFVYRVLNTIFWPETKTYPLSAIDEDWIPIISESEEKISEEQKNLLSTELDLLRKRNFSSARTVIFNRVASELKDIVIPEISLTPDLRNRIFKDLLTKISNEWLKVLEELAPGIQDHWFSSAYEKNILGQLINLTDQMAPDKLTSSGFAQTLRGIHLGIIQALAIHRKIPLNECESDRVLDLIANTLINPLITLWITTAEQALASLTKQGQLPSKWSREKKVFDDYIQKIKSEGVSAKYSEGDPDPVRQAYLKKNKSQLLDKIIFEERKASLTKGFDTKKIQVESEIDQMEFNKAKTSIGLFFRRK